MSLCDLIYTSADIYSMHAFPKNAEKVKWEMGIFFLVGMRQQRVTQEENKLSQRHIYLIEPICFQTSII